MFNNIIIYRQLKNYNDKMIVELRIQRKKNFY